MRPSARLRFLVMVLVIGLGAGGALAKPKAKPKRTDSSSDSTESTGSGGSSGSTGSTGSGKRAAASRAGDVHVHEGFFLRMTFGLGYSRAICSETSDVYFHGLALFTDFAIGGSVTRNLALHVSIFGHSVLYGKAQPDGQEAILLGYGFGGGLTYHIQPVNLYLSAAFGVGFHASAAIGTNDASFTLSKAGFAMEFLLGKEWWVSENWGLGIATQLIYMYLPDKNADFHWNDVGIGLLMTATYN